MFKEEDNEIIGENRFIVLSKVAGAYCLFLVVAGTLMNLLTMKICLRNNLRKQRVFIHITFVAFVDTVSLYFWCLDTFLFEWYQIKLENVNILFCKFSSFIQYTCLQWSSWLLVMLSLEYFTHNLSKAKGTVQLLENRTICISSLLGLLIAIINLNTLYFNGVLIIRPMKEDEIICYKSEYESWSSIWWALHALIYGILPCMLLLLLDLIKISITLKAKFNRNHRVTAATAAAAAAAVTSDYEHEQASFKWNDGGRSMNLFILVINVAFLLFAFPSTFINGFFYETLKHSVNWHYIFVLNNCFLFTFHSFKIVFLTLFCSRFRRELARQLKSIASSIIIVQSKNRQKNQNQHQNTITTFSITDNSSA